MNERERFLREFERRLRLRGKRRTDALAEIESHIDDAVAAGEDETAVIARLGEPGEVARRLNGVASPHRLPTVFAAAVVFAVAASVTTGLLQSKGARIAITDFGDRGQTIDSSHVPLADMSSLRSSGFGEEVRKIGERAGVAFYVSRSDSGRLCVATGSGSGATPRLNHFVGCQNSHPAAFPSAKQPVLDFSPVKTPNPREVVYVTRLVGFATDGVERISVRNEDRAVLSVEVVGNVYATDWLDQPVQGTEIVASDGNGVVVYRKRLLLP